MQHATRTTIVRTFIGATILFFLTLSLNSLMISTAQATPQLAKGKPCQTCHTGSPPSKSNVKK
jgi:hypothetical protein